MSKVYVTANVKPITNRVHETLGRLYDIELDNGQNVQAYYGQLRARYGNGHDRYSPEVHLAGTEWVPTRINDAHFTPVRGHYHEAIGQLYQVTCKEGYVFYTHHEWMLHMDAELADPKSLNGRSFDIDFGADDLYKFYIHNFKIV